ncbi:exopolygalacturonase clone GBGE184-like [Herrania umbratica]|uniref:Polygalacturonase n=1 Tax=Herrania umbratica TaxID=108875 RepID=A0A6J1AWI6_9ROSI|nr:exopolygalacturonase clone GBGE184-like [Herrania umbratica]
MASVATIVRVSAILLLCLALQGCDGKVPFNAAEALAKARAAAVGNVGPDVKHFNVLDYGAKADGKTDSSINFIRAFKAACNYNGNAMMVIPDGNFLIGPVIFSGPCFNPSPLIIQANGMVKAQSDISYYAGGADDTDWITFQSIDGLILTGHGTFHGQGAEVWKYNNCGKKSNCVRLPATLKFIKVNDAIIRGITSIDPKGFHFFISMSQNFRIFNIKLVAPAESPNTDGIHMSKSNLVKISKSIVATGDDCVSMIQGSTNISIKKVFCGPGHGFSIGSLGHYDAEADVQGIVVKNCSLTDTDNGLRIKTYKKSSPSKASGIIFRDIVMTRVKNPIIIDQEYGNRRSNEPSKVSISDVFYTNIRGTTISKVAVDLTCSSSNPCQGIHLNNVNLQYAGSPNGDLPFSSNCVNAKVAYIGAQSPLPCH